MRIIISLIGYIVGVFCASFFSSVYLILALSLFTGCIVLYTYVSHRLREPASVLFILFFLCVTVGFIRVSFSALEKDSTLSAYEGVSHTFSGVVVHAEHKEQTARLWVRVYTVDGVPHRETILLNAPLYPSYRYGDMISFRTTLETPDNFSSNERVFNYRGYLRAQGIYYVGWTRATTRDSAGHGFFIKRWLLVVREKFLFSINHHFEQPASSLLSGIILGQKETLGTELLSAFRSAGLSHIIVLSGYNIAVVGKAIMSLVPRGVSAGVSVGFGALGIFLFMILSLGGSSVFRSGLMIILALWATSSGRQYTAHTGFLVVVVLMLVYNPLLLVFDPSFILSCLATLGLIVSHPLIASKLSFIPETFLLRDTITQTLSAQLWVLPYILYSMGGLSPYSLLANVLVLPLIPLIMSLGFISAVSGIVSSYLAFMPSLATTLLLGYCIKVVEVIQKLPGSSFVVPPFSFGVLLCLYVLMCVVHRRLVGTSARIVK